MGNSPFGNGLTGHIVYLIILSTLEILILPILWLQVQQNYWLCCSPWSKQVMVGISLVAELKYIEEAGVSSCFFL